MYPPCTHCGSKTKKRRLTQDKEPYKLCNDCYILYMVRLQINKSYKGREFVKFDSNLTSDQTNSKNI